MLSGISLSNQLRVDVGGDRGRAFFVCGDDHAEEGVGRRRRGPAAGRRHRSRGDRRGPASRWLCLIESSARWRRRRWPVSRGVPGDGFAGPRWAAEGTLLRAVDQIAGCPTRSPRVGLRITRRCLLPGVERRAGWQPRARRRVLIVALLRPAASVKSTRRISACSPRWAAAVAITSGGRDAVDRVCHLATDPRFSSPRRRS